MNTQKLIDVFEAEARTEEPFFAFANYMDTHRPYIPPADVQQRHFGRVLSRSEIERLNDQVADPWEFAAADACGAIDDEDVGMLQNLYAGEVETADAHLDRLIDALQRTGQLDETLIIVTGDHGENLGEVDEMGRRRMGHESSISDALAHVPLLIAYPTLDAATIEEPFSLINLYQLFIEVGTELEISNSLIRQLSDGTAICEYPATGGE
jgi:arylsulfatase A-like enzyme